MSGGDAARGGITMVDSGIGGDKDAFLSVREKIRADLVALRRAVRECRRCPGGRGGIPGRGEPGAPLFMLAGVPGPGASAANPWGAWWDLVSSRMCGEWGWSAEGAYLSTALRCALGRVTRKEVQRCSALLAEELLVVGPRLVLVSGRVAVVAVREALGGEVPEKPRAGDTCGVFNTTFLFNLDVARIEGDEEAARVFWRVLRRAEKFLA